FAGGSDEVSFASLGQRAFLDTVRDLVSAEPPRPEVPAMPPIPPAVVDLREALVRAGVQFLEALAAVLTSGPAKPGNGETPARPPALSGTDSATGQPVLQLPLPTADLLRRGADALRVIVGRTMDTPPPSS